MHCRLHYLLIQNSVTAVFFATMLFNATPVFGSCLDDDLAADLSDSFQLEIRPLLAKACGDCHWGAEANAGLDLDSFDSLDQILNADRKWMAIANEISSGNMPPDGSTPLTSDQKKLVLDWIEQSFALVNCSNPDPGRVTLRKLNRIEYKNSIRDLFGFDYEPAKNFPGDDVGHGFDNIADVLSLPPLLMEKYLEAAETISRQVIVDPNRFQLDLSVSAASFKTTKDQHNKDGKLAMFTTGFAEKPIHFPQAGKYALAVRAYGDQGGDEAVKMSVFLDNEKIKTVDVKANRRKPKLYSFKLPVEDSGDKRLKIRFDNDFYVPRKIGGIDRNLHLLAIYIKGPAQTRLNRGILNFSSTDDQAAEQFIKRLLFQAFRRPADEAEKKRFIKLFRASRNRGDTLYEATQMVVQAVLISPQFLYKIQAPVAEGKIRSLNNFELATSLSYFLTSSTPDQELLRLASEGILDKPEVWKHQISRLLQSKKAAALVENFASQWLNLRLLKTMEPDPKQFPECDGELLKDMETETKLLFTDILQRDASVLELLECNYTFLNERLAKHYQIPNVNGEAFQRVSFSNEQRQGILTHASILTLTSNALRTSPVKRGKWVMENILGEEPPPPLASVMPLDDQKQLVGSLRERMQQHRTDPNCASCHAKMDAIGFALEHYDAVGRFRLKDEDFAIDATSTLPDGTELNGALGLQQQLKTKYKDAFLRCFCEKLLTYALGRGLNYSDRCTVNAIIENAKTNGYRFSDFVIGVATSDPFMKRSGKTTRMGH